MGRVEEEEKNNFSFFSFSFSLASLHFFAPSFRARRERDALYALLTRKLKAKRTLAASMSPILSSFLFLRRPLIGVFVFFFCNSLDLSAGEASEVRL